MAPKYNVSDLSKLEETHLRTQRAFSMIVKAHNIVIRADNEDELLSNIVDLIADRAGPYNLAWIGKIDDETIKQVTPMAEASKKNGYLDSIMVHWGDDIHSQGPTGTAIRERRTQLQRDVQNDPKYVPWRDRAVEYGFHTSISIPIECDKDIYGAINVCSDDENAFAKQEVELLETLAGDIGIGLNLIRLRDEREKAQLSLREALFGTVHTIALTMEKRDPYTAGHQGRVSELATAIASSMGLDNERLEWLRLGANIHDIGKISVPTDILNKPGKLTSAELEIIKTHPQIGYDIMRDVNFLYPVKEIILQHHERLDGTGYPHKLKADEITLEAKIVAVADVVEAMSSHRPYRPAIGIDAALAEIKRGRGSAYEPNTVDICISLFKNNNFEWAGK